ncbi:CubicO group peptidase (beta-lactamase class C family) [Paenibacillus sp. 4624]|uniref:serine hydrolase domain-containing protein n=1 Tax=Paenibacillus sp. 4624 TaxID=3156453 RepID=UPI003D1A8C7C
MLDAVKITEKVREVMEQKGFSGVVLCKQKGKTLFQIVRGYANRSDELLNDMNTRFGIASGCKVFTAVSIGQLIEQGHFTLDSKLKDVLNLPFPAWNSEITVHQLLTHTSGVPDYFDEEVMNDFSALWKDRPVYAMRQLRDFLPMFQHLPMKSAPGEKFHYNNAAFIVLGLIVEQYTGMAFTTYVEEHIFKRAGMQDSGYFLTDQLPRNTAIGYIDADDGTWTSNIFSIPVQGGADGGAYVTAPDMIRFWDALLGHKLLGEEMTRHLLTPYAHDEHEEFYGLGIWLELREKEIFKTHVMGFDPGVSFMSGVYPKQGVQLVVVSNQESGPYPITLAVEEAMV